LTMSRFATAFATVVLSFGCGQTTGDPSANTELPQVFAGGAHSCLLHEGGVAECWGDYGASSIEPPADTFETLALGGSFLCGLHGDGSLNCWGSPSMSDPPPQTFREVSAAGSFACGIGDDSHVDCWHENPFGALEAPAGQFQRVAAGGSTGCALDEAGYATCWGANGVGQATPPGIPLTKISLGEGHGCGLTSDDHAMCWGDQENFGELPSDRIRDVVANGWGTCIIHLDRTVSCFPEYLNPVPAGEFEQVAVGSSHACGVRRDASVACWGDNAAGQATPPPI
jgi:hypothetical protein